MLKFLDIFSFFYSKHQIQMIGKLINLVLKRKTSL